MAGHGWRVRNQRLPPRMRGCSPHHMQEPFSKLRPNDAVRVDNQRALESHPSVPPSPKGASPPVVHDVLSGRIADGKNLGVV
jgi:hypothetical protein